MFLINVRLLPQLPPLPTESLPNTPPPQLLIITKISQYFKERSIISSSSNIWILPFLIGLVTLKKDANLWIRYGLLSGLVSYPYCHAILVGWNAKNSNTVRTRAVSAALYNMFVQSGNIVAVNIYRDDDKPLCECPPHLIIFTSPGINPSPTYRTRLSSIQNLICPVC